MSGATEASVAIRCEGVGKAFKLFRRRNDQLRQVLFGRWRDFHEERWVLRDVSFEVRRGESVGIVGRNGAGKTTLLQMLCGIVEPTCGTASVVGRVAPILALGSGFDNELTGRENAMIGGAILGLRRVEIAARMDSIAAFADIGDFFHQPLKMYSSGMYSRLAFAICAHADADVLIVDEALSVGDAAFGRKCQAFVQGFARTGTIVVVSHALETLEDLCDRVVWIDEGRVRASGTPAEVLPGYREAMGARPPRRLREPDPDGLHVDPADRLGPA